MENVNKESRVVAPEKNANRTGESVLLALVILATLALYLAMPFRPVEKIAIPHAVLFLQALQPEFLNEVWFGVDLPDAKPTGERALAFAIGTALFLYLAVVGRALLTPWRRLLLAQRAGRLTTLFFSGVLGLVALSTLSLLLGLAKCANAPVPFILLVAPILLLVTRRKKSESAQEDNDELNYDSRSLTWGARVWDLGKKLLMALFVAFYLFVATQPLFEYDVVEYHAQGAREFYESGAIQFSRNNVYVNMPLGAETFYLTGFNLMRDLGFNEQNVLRLGSLVGKTLLAYATLLTALGIAAFCKRFVRAPNAPYWAAVIYLSFPLLFENVANGLNDATLGLAFFAVLFALALEVARPRETEKHDETRRRVAVASLIGVLLGFAIAIKYTAVPFILAPTLLALLLLELAPNSRNALRASLNHTPRDDDSPDATRRTNPCLTLVVSLAVAILVGGGWYYKNYVATGNPVYPLAYGLFGDSTGLWNDAINERWVRAHSASSYAPTDLANALANALFLDNYASPFLFFLPMILIMLVGARLVRRQDKDTSDQRILAILFALLLLFLLAWLLGTHRIARFLIPFATLPTIILGACFARLLTAQSVLLRGAAIFAVLTILGYSGLMIDLIGQGRLAPLAALERDPDRYADAALYFNDHPETLAQDGDDRARILLIGEAKAFAYRAPILYSTCWNDSPLMSALDGAIELDGENVKAITNPNKIRAALKEMRVKYILVDFDELYRFRSEGNYGFNNPEINESLFFSLVGAGVLELVDSEKAALRYNAKLFKALDASLE